MKYLVKVRRMNDGAVRLYEVPDEMPLAPGAIVEVEFADKHTVGVVASGCYQVDGCSEQMVRDFFGIDFSEPFKRVTGLFVKQIMEPTTDAPDQPDADADDTNEEDAE